MAYPMVVKKVDTMVPNSAERMVAPMDDSKVSWTDASTAGPMAEQMAAWMAV